MLKGSASHHAPSFAIVRQQLDEQTSVISVEGELDLSTAPRLKMMLLDALESGSGRLVLDLSGTTFMDSTALGVLVAVNRHSDLSGPLTVACSNEKVLQIFEFSGTDAAFAIHPNLEDALEHLRADTVGTG